MARLMTAPEATTCTRCGTASEDASFCPTCGLDRRTSPSLPTPEAIAAARREARWLADHRESVAVAEIKRALADRYGPDRPMMALKDHLVLNSAGVPAEPGSRVD